MRIRSVAWLGLAVFVLVAPQTALAKTYYVDAAIGDDSYGPTKAQNPDSPWRTIKRALSTAVAGDTILVQPGLYMQYVESKRDGIDGLPIVLRSATPGAAVIQPPQGSNGIFIKHSYMTVDGFTVTGAVTGIKLGPHGVGDGPVNELVAQNNTVYGNSNNGMSLSNAMNGLVAFNTVYQNGRNGISYSGNGGVIHHNVAHDNAVFGIYVKDGVDHQVYDNQAYSNTVGDIKILGTLLPPPGGFERTFYVDAVNGNDTYTADQAQSSQTPWKTIRTALAVAVAGDTVIVLPGVYAESVESKRDGTAGSPFTIRALLPGTATVQPPAGTSGVFISHNYYVLDGFVVTGAGTGLQLGPHAVADGPVSGLVATNNHVYGNGSAGIKFQNAVSGSAMHNVVYSNGKDGIVYNGVSANIFNNVVYGNGLALTQNYGITLDGGNGHQVLNNTVYGNVQGGIRLGTSTSFPVFSTVLNNIVVGNPVGVKEPTASGYTGRATLDFNNVFGNSVKNYDLSPTGSVVGSGSISADPVFVAAANGDFRLGRVATGQSGDSPCIDRGSDTADALGLGGRTAFTDKYPDTGRVDLGVHPTILRPTTGTLTISQVSMTFAQAADDSFSLSANLRPGADSDGIAPGVNYAEVGLGNLLASMPVVGFTQAGSTWSFTGSGTIKTGTFQLLADGSVNVTVQGSGVSLSYNDSPVSIQFRIGDDFGSAVVPLKGTLQFP